MGKAADDILDAEKRKMSDEDLDTQISRYRHSAFHGPQNDPHTAEMSKKAQELENERTRRRETQREQKKSKAFNQ